MKLVELSQLTKEEMEDNEHSAQVLRTEAEIMELIAIQEKEDELVPTLGLTLTQFEQLLKLEILDEARRLKIIKPSFNHEETVLDKLEVLKKQKFAIWFIWDSLNVIRVEKGLIVNIYIHTSGKDITTNKDIWKMIRDVLKKCPQLVEKTELEVRSKMLQWKIAPELRKMLRQVIKVEDKEEEFDLVPDFRILREESEVYQTILTDKKTGIKAIGRGSIKFRNQVDWGTKLELSRKVREWEFRNREENG
jgi:hypothetical protein